MQNIFLSDITMKTADSSKDFTLSFREKIELCKLLDRLNVSVIEFGPIQNRKIDTLLIKSVASAVKNSTLAMPVGQSVADADAAWAALSCAGKSRLQVEAPMSPAQMEYFWHKKPPKMLDAIRELVGHCRGLTSEVEFIAEDATRAERDFVCQAIRTAIEAGAGIVTLGDDAGTMLPVEFNDFIRELRSAVPELENVRLGIRCSDTMHMACALALTAAIAGVQEIKTISCPGNVVKLIEIADAVRTRGASCGLDCGIAQTEIQRVTGMIDRMCTANDSRTPFDSGVRENTDVESISLTAQDDRTAITAAIRALGYDLSEEDKARVCEEFERIAARKGSISSRELDTIVASTALQVPPTYRLTGFVINCGNLISASAQIRLQKGAQTLDGICLGDGPIDAAFRTIEHIIGHHYELDDFQIQSVTEGREAMGETLVRLRSAGKLYSGRGISTDIVGASIQAYINALNKIAYEEAAL